MFFMVLVLAGDPFQGSQVSRPGAITSRLPHGERIPVRLPADDCSLPTQGVGLDHPLRLAHLHEGYGIARAEAVSELLKRFSLEVKRVVELGLVVNLPVMDVQRGEVQRLSHSCRKEEGHRVNLLLLFLRLRRGSNSCP